MPLGRFRSPSNLGTGAQEPVSPQQFSGQKPEPAGLTNVQRPGLFSPPNPFLLPQRLQGFLPGAGDGVRPFMLPGLERFLNRRGFAPGPVPGGLTQSPVVESGPKKRGIKDLLRHFGVGKKQ